MERPTDQTLPNPFSNTGPSWPSDSGRQPGSKESKQPRSIVIASTFAADSLQAIFLKFWMKTLTISCEIAMALFPQVMQELLTPRGLLSRSKDGFNILIIRLQHWIRDRLLGGSVEQSLDHLQRGARDFAATVRVLRGTTGTSILTVFCPPSSDLAALYAFTAGAQDDLN